MFNHDLPFDPTHGRDLEQLLKIQPPEPVHDFESFWRQTYDMTLATALNFSMSPCGFSDKKFEVFEVTFDGFEGFTVGGWLTVPREVEARRGVVMSHGYGGRLEPAKVVPGPPAIVLSVCARGFTRSERPNLPAEVPEHVLFGIESKETYLHRGCVADIWASVSALLAYRPELAGSIDFMGTSFGGGIGALALPWEPRFRSGFLEVPSFGHHPLRVTLPCTGSGQYVSKAVADEPRLLDEVLAYYDAAVAGRFMTLPVFVAPALFDPAVPPAGQFAVANAIATKTLHVKPAGHFEWRGLPAAARKLNSELHDWLTRLG